MIIRIFYLFIYFTLSICAIVPNLSIDCDAEFAETATKLASEQIHDQQIVQYVHAVMSSCNKAPIQKMAEASVFLLHKGTVTPKVMGEIKKTFTQIQKKKENEINEKMTKLPPELYSTAQKIRQISTSAGLSGNERHLQIEQAMSVIPASYQYQLLQIFDESPTPPKLDGTKVVEKPNDPIEVTTPSSFAIPKQTIRSEDENLLAVSSGNIPRERSDLFNSGQQERLTVPRVNMPFQPRPKEVIINPQPITASQQNVLFPDLPPTRPIEPSVHVRQNAMSGIQKLLESPNFDQLLSSIVQKGAKIAEGPVGQLPQSVGTVDHTKVKQEVGLLNPSVWSDAAKFLSRNSNDLPSALSQFIEQNTRNLPQVFAPLSSNTGHLERIRNSDFLPQRRQQDGALDSYDTHVDRFAKNGPLNRIQIGDLSSLNFAGLNNQNSRENQNQNQNQDHQQQVPPQPQPQTTYIGQPQQQSTYPQMRPHPSSYQQPEVQSSTYQVQQGPQLSTYQAIRPKTVDSIVGSMPTMPPISGYATYAPAPSAIAPKVVQPEEITGSYRQPISPIYNQRMPNGLMRNVRINAVNEQ